VVGNVTATEDVPPNFVLILADDMGYGDLSYTGHPTILTPNLDALAMSGVRFTSMYAGANICSASRAAMLTGRYAIRNGVYTSFSWPVDNSFRVFYPYSTGSLMHSENTVAQLLHQADYANGLVGKWHLGHYNNSLPLDFGFDYWFGLPYSQDEGCPPGYGVPCDPHGAIFTPTPLYANETIIQQPVNLETLVPRMTDRATTFIDTAVNNSQPFFLYLAYDEVHIPLFASPEFEGTSRRGLYGDAASEMDASIGRVVAHLEAKGLLDNTYIIFSSDNGAWSGLGTQGGFNGPFRGEKGSTFEGGHRVPGFIRGPNIQPGRIHQGVASHMDFFNTILDLAGVPIPDDRIYDGESLVPILVDGDSAEHRCYFFYRDSSLHAVRCGSYKMHYITRCGFCLDPPTKHDPPLLYNLDHDPSEVWGIDPEDPVYQAVKIEMDHAVTLHEANLVKGSPELDGQSPFVQPCCNKVTDCRCGPY